MTKPQCRKLSKPIFISELATEFMMNALRLKNGVPIDYFEKRTGRTYEEIEQKLLDLQSQGFKTRTRDSSVQNECVHNRQPA